MKMGRDGQTTRPDTADAGWRRAAIVSSCLRIVPGDPIAMMIPPGATPADIERLRGPSMDLIARSRNSSFRVWFRSSAAISAVRSACIRTLFELVLARASGHARACAGAATADRHCAGTGGGLEPVSIFAGGRAEWVIDGGVGVFLASDSGFLWALILLLFLACWSAAADVGPDPIRRLDISFPDTNFYLIESLVTGRLDVTRRAALSHDTSGDQRYGPLAFRRF